MKNATISLADCLACSGCITSAETVLVKAQSVEEFEKRIESEKYTVISLSMESIIAIAKNYGMGYDEVFFLKKILLISRKFVEEYLFIYFNQSLN